MQGDSDDDSGDDSDDDSNDDDSNDDSQTKSSVAVLNTTDTFSPPTLTRQKAILTESAIMPVITFHINNASSIDELSKTKELINGVGNNDKRVQLTKQYDQKFSDLKAKYS
jgi:hypothetical protein